MLSGTSVSSRNSAIKTQQQQQQKSVWSDILSSVENAAVGPCYRQLIVLGSLDDMLSTNSELSHDRKTKPPLRYSFESLFLDEAASKDATDLLGRLGIYEVSASQFLPLVKPVLGGCLKETLVVIQLDATDPWTFFDSLEDWLQGLEDLLLDMTREDDDGYKSCKKWVESKWSKYASIISKPEDKVVRKSGLELPLEPEILSHNLGVDLMVVCTKSELLDKELQQDQVDFVQQSLRSLCLKYGASLFFASQRNPQSLQTLQHYIRHRLFSSHYVPDKSLSHPTFKMAFNLPPEPQYIDPASLCVPVGWDNVSKIQGVCETFDGCKFVNNSYPSANDTLLGSAKREYAMNLGPKPDPPVNLAFVEESEVYAEEDLTFLTRLEPLLRVNDAAVARSKGTMDTKSPSNDDTRKYISGPSQRSGSPSPSEGSSPLGVSSPTDSKELKRDLMEDVTQRLAKLSSSVKSVSTDGSAAKPVLGSSRTRGAAASVGAGGASQNEVLANFFQSLLAKKGKTAAGSPPPSTAKSPSPKE